ncbi:MAG: LemA family protein [Bdellovibrionales bacterium]|nr:LemA family protein [Bdellovibrionales bacterium]
MFGYIGIGLILVIAIFVVSIYNNLIRLRNAFKNAFAQIDVQLKRRYDLIPNLVETAKKYMSHEKDTFEAVINARNQAQSAASAVSQNPGDAEAMGLLNKAEGVLSRSMGQFMAVFENYPDLKADKLMGDLMEELSSTENKIAYARQSFNDSVMFYNNARETFPNNLVANNFGFRAAQPLEVEMAEERQAVKVQF